MRLTGEQGQADDWGAIDHEQGETDQPIRFQGQYRDEESGLYYNRYRYYAPELGRYVTQDPIGLLGGSNFYIYPVNPLQHKDSLGLSPAFTNVSGMTPSQVGQYAKAQAAINSISTKMAEIKNAITWTNPYAPDCVSAQIDIYVASGSITYARYGDIIASAGAARSYPASSVGGNVSAGFLLCPNEPTPSKSELNNFLEGVGLSGGFYDIFGGEVVTNSAGTAVNVGAGIGGAGVTPGSNTWKIWGFDE